MLERGMTRDGGCAAVMGARSRLGGVDPARCQLIPEDESDPGQAERPVLDRPVLRAAVSGGVSCRARGSRGDAAADVP